MNVYGRLADFLRTKRGPRRTHDHEQRYPGREHVEPLLSVVSWPPVPPVQRGQRPPQRIGQAGRSRSYMRPMSSSATGSASACGHARPRGDTSACSTKGTGLSTSTMRSTTSTAARPDSAARERSQARWWHEDEHHLGSRPRAGTITRPASASSCATSWHSLESERRPTLGALSADGG